MQEKPCEASGEETAGENKFSKVGQCGLLLLLSVLVFKKILIQSGTSKKEVLFSLPKKEAGEWREIMI